MLTVQTNIALQLVGTLSEEELAVFAKEFEKLQKPVARCKPKKIKQTTTFLSVEECLNKLKKRYSIQAQGKLA